MAHMYHVNGQMRRFPLESTDNSMCEYKSSFYVANAVDNAVNIRVYAQITRDNTIRADTFMIIHDNIAFIVEADLYSHLDEWGLYNYHTKTLSSEWLEPLKPFGVTTIYTQDRSPEVYILTKQIFHNVIVRDILDQNLNLPNDIIEIIMKI